MATPQVPAAEGSIPTDPYRVQTLSSELGTCVNALTPFSHSLSSKAIFYANENNLQGGSMNDTSNTLHHSQHEAEHAGGAQDANTIPGQLPPTRTAPDTLVVHQENLQSEILSTQKGPQHDSLASIREHDRTSQTGPAGLTRRYEHTDSNTDITTLVIPSTGHVRPAQSSTHANIEPASLSVTPILADQSISGPIDRQQSHLHSASSSGRADGALQLPPGVDHPHSRHLHAADTLLHSSETSSQSAPPNSSSKHVPTPSAATVIAAATAILETMATPSSSSAASSNALLMSHLPHSTQHLPHAHAALHHSQPAAAKLVIHSRSRSMAKSVTLVEAPTTPPIMSRAASTVTTIDRTSGSTSPLSGSQKSSRAPSFFASIGVMSPPKQASSLSMSGIPNPDDPSNSLVSPRDRTSSTQMPRRSNSVKMLIARARSKSFHPSSDSASVVVGSSPQTNSGVSTPLRQSITRTTHTPPDTSPMSTSGRRRSSGASDKRRSKDNVRSSGESSPHNTQSPPRGAAVKSHDSVVGGITGIGVRPVSNDHVRQSVPAMNGADQARAAEQHAAGKATRPVGSVPAIVATSSPSINDRTEKRKASSGSLPALGPSIRITTTVTEEGGKETVEVIDLEETNEEDNEEEEVWQQGKDRYYDPEEEDEAGDSPGPPVRTLVPLRDRYQQPADTSSTSLKAGGSRNKLGSSTRLGSRNGLNGPIAPPSSDIAAYTDPLASARNLFLGSNNDAPASGVPRADDGGAGADYLQYLLTRKFSSTNFISRIESKDVVWDTGQPVAKFIGPFLLGQVIGKGSFGKVKDGMCSETLQPVAIKILAHKRLRKIQFGIEAVTKEIQTLRRLRGHANVVRLLEVYAKAEDPDGNIDVLPWSQYLETEMRYKTLKRFMVFEFCHGNLQSLLDSTPDGTIPLHQAQDYTIQLTEGLLYLHARHVVHRDIKPANLLLTLDGVLKISDFGVAEVLTPYDGTDLCQNFAGTQQYMSPEVAAGEMNPSGEKVDVWASGVTVYNMVFGTFPFNFSNGTMGMFESVQASTLEIPKGTNPDLVSFLHGVLEKLPANRFTLTQMHQHPFLCTDSSSLADGPYVPLPTLTADAAAAHAAVTLSRGKGTLARPVSPRTLSRRPVSPEPEEDPRSDQESKLPYSLFPALEPLFPELATLSPLPDAVQKAAEETSKLRRSSLGKRKSIVASFGGAPSAAGSGDGFFARTFGRKSSSGSSGNKRFGFSVG